MKRIVTLIQTKSFEVDAEGDEQAVADSEDVKSQLNSVGWELADILVETTPDAS